MFSNARRHIWKTISVRLTVWYSLLFVASSLVLFGLAYVLLSSSLQRRDREEIQSELNDYAMVFQSEGLDTLMEELEADRAEGDEPFFVRLADAQNRPVFLSIPDALAGKFDVTQLEKTTIPGDGRWIYLGEKETMTICSPMKRHLKLPPFVSLRVGCCKSAVAQSSERLFSSDFV